MSASGVTCKGDIKIKTSTGKAQVSNTVCQGELRIDISTGVTELTDVSCKSLSTTGSTGDVILKNLIADEGIDIERSTGDVEFDLCDASEIHVTTDTGRVTGSLLSEKVFIARSDTGRIDVPNTANGGRCEITTDTGNIKITVQK